MNSLLRKVHLFNGLSADEIELLANICTKLEISSGELVIEQNTTGGEVYIIGDGAIDVFVAGLGNERPIVILGDGQVFGEMALIDQGYRSASGRAGKSGCVLYKIQKEDFHKLCDDHTHIGYVVMRNMAIDLAFKLRHRNLAAL